MVINTNTTADINLFGYVVSHTNAQYICDDWFATSYNQHIKNVDDYFVATTTNITYQIPNYRTLVIPMAALDNIRMAPLPEKALRIVHGSFGQSIY